MRAAESGAGIEDGVALEHDRGAGGQAGHHGVVRLLHFDAEKRAGAEELVLRNALHDVGEGEIELLDGEESGVAKRDERAARR